MSYFNLFARAFYKKKLNIVGNCCFAKVYQFIKEFEINFKNLKIFFVKIVEIRSFA